MKCTGKEWDHCRVEKMGCEGCYYNEDNDRDINNLIEELTNVRPDELRAEGLKLFNKINEIIDINKELEEENRIFALEGSRVRLKIHIDKNYIPVSLVEEKIEELNNSIDLAIDNSKGGLDEEFIEKGSELLAQKKVLQELLEKRK